MKIKRYTDNDMRHVLRQVKAEQGPDAVILSNRRIAGGIEVIAANDYDESLMHQALGPAPEENPITQSNVRKARRKAVKSKQKVREQSADSGAPPTPIKKRTEASADNTDQIDDVRSEISGLRDLLETQLSGLVWRDTSRRSQHAAQMLRNMSRLGFAADIAKSIVADTGPVETDKDLWRKPLLTLTQTLPVAEDELLSRGGVAALIGPTGVGKTTTIAKLAARFAMQYGYDEVALICADAYRIGAKEHLMAFANIIGSRVWSASTPDELLRLVDRLSSKKLVLIDTEGISQRDLNLAKRLSEFVESQDKVRFFLTLSATTQEAGLDESIRRFNTVPLSGAILTKIDEAGQLGCSFSALIRNDLPLAYVSDGQRIPDDIHAAAKKKLWLVNQAVECAESSKPIVDERTMAEQYLEARAVNE